MMEEEGEGDHQPFPRKRIKTLIQSPPASLKGKEKMVETVPSPEPVECPSTEGEVCGICLSETEQSIRGRIDSCEHYFCFVCIMEWSKVESRCPMCKQRFRSIWRPPVPGVFIRERVVKVPVRDQVDDHHGAAITADPYAEVNCSECQSSVDENLLLLCDLCDSAAHTYCVGLGATVPEGDWFCSDCTITRNEHSKLEMENDPCGQKLPTVFTRDCQDSLPVSISDIVSDESCPSHRSSNKHLTETRMGYNNSILSSVGDTAQNMVEHSLQSSSVMTSKTALSRTKVSEQGARTLRQCRDVHDRVRRFRENWNSFQNGSLSFTAGFIDFVKMVDDRKQKNISANSSTSRKDQALHSSEAEQLETENGDLDNKLCRTKPQDVARAWKMMEVAKSIRKTQSGNVFNYPVSPASRSVTKKNLHKETRDRNSVFVPKRKSDENILSGAIGSTTHNFKSQIDKEKRVCNDIIYDKLSNHKDSLPNNSLKNRNDLKSAQVTIYCGGTQEQISHHISSKEPIRVVEQDIPTCSSSVTCDKRKHADFSKCERTLPRMSKQMHRTSNESSSKAINDNKSEVQSLVKLNLKLQLINHQHLEGDKFKEVARIATHTILAACGLEHSKSSARSIPSPICKHTEKRKSNLMPSSCKQCFFYFVKEVVAAILSEKAPLSEH